MNDGRAAPARGRLNRADRRGWWPDASPAAPGTAQELVAAAAKSGAKLQVGHIERFNPGFKAIAGAGLKPVFIECHRLSPFRFRSADVGVVFDLMIHDLDIIHCLVQSEVKRVEAVGVPVISRHEDIANARLTFENGCVANVTASRISIKEHAPHPLLRAGLLRLD